MNPITISLGGFYYRDIPLIDKLQISKNIQGVSGVELHVKHGYRFDDQEIDFLSFFSYNTLHLHGYSHKDRERLLYCSKIIPNFQHAVLHPDIAKLDDISKDLEDLFSFENMDSEKTSYQHPYEMTKLFDRFPRSSFTLDICHAEENHIPIADFAVLKNPSQIHFSIPNKNYYENYPQIETPHALAIFQAGYRFDFALYRDTIITCEGVYPPGDLAAIQQEVDLIKSMQ